MSNTRSETESIGLRVVAQLVREYWKCRFQELDARNDDGIDGIIFLSKDGEATGETIFVQIKCGSTYKTITKKEPNKLRIKLGIEHIRTHRHRWDRYPGPVVLIYVDNLTEKKLPKAWWTNLKADASYHQKFESYVLIDNKNTFGEHSKGHFKNLCMHHLDYALESVDLDYQDFAYIRLSRPLKQTARAKYKDLATKGLSNPTLGKIEINRVGWKHITRPARRTTHITQSFELLGALEKMLTTVKKYEFVKHIETYVLTKNTAIIDQICIRAKVSFPHRYQSVITIMLKRKRIISPNGKAQLRKIWFLSVFESRRGKSIF